MQTQSSKDVEKLDDFTVRECFSFSHHHTSTSTKMSYRLDYGKVSDIVSEYPSPR